MSRLVLPRTLAQLLVTVLADLPQAQAAALLSSLGIRLIGRGLQ